jgi:hypothetical protein
VRARILLLVELFIVAGLVLLTRCANYRDVFIGDQIYFVDADCYARMTRARICWEHPGTIVRHHDFENFPAGTSPHTTAPLDYLIVAIAALVMPFNGNALDLAGAVVSPFIAVALGIFLCWWTRRISMRFRFALLILYAVSPILAHGTALGRPDHQSLLIGLIAVALCAEWRVWEGAHEPPCHPERIRGIPWRYLKGKVLGILRLRFASLRMTVEEGAPSQRTALQRSIQRWNVVSGGSWALALWVSLYEPLILFALVLATALITERKTGSRAKWIAFTVVCAIAIVIERRLPVWPDQEFSQALQNWSGSIGELSHVPVFSRVWFEWCSWLLLLAPILFWTKPRHDGAPLFLRLLLPVTFLLTIWQARWSYFFALIFTLAVPEILGVLRRPLIAAAIFLVALFPVAQAWDASLSEDVRIARAENEMEQTELRALASQIDGPFLAPWWLSPDLADWSTQPGVSGSSHESISGIVDCASFYAATEPGSAAEICQRRRVKWVVSYDADRLAQNSARILGHAIGDNALGSGLDRHPSTAPPFLKLVSQTARFKLYRVEGR